MKKLISVIVIFALMLIAAAAAETGWHEGLGIGSSFYKVETYENKDDVTFVATAGDHVEIAGKLFGTKAATVIDTFVKKETVKTNLPGTAEILTKSFCIDCYTVRINETGELFNVNRNQIEK